MPHLKRSKWGHPMGYEKQPETSQSPEGYEPAPDTPLKAAIRKAFDSPTLANIEAVATLASAERADASE